MVSYAVRPPMRVDDLDVPLLRANATPSSPRRVSAYGRVPSATTVIDDDGGLTGFAARTEMSGDSTAVGFSEHAPVSKPTTTATHEPGILIISRSSSHCFGLHSSQ